MKRKPKTIIIIMILLASSLCFIKSLTVKAESGRAKVYIVCLPDVGSWWVNNASRAKEGAIEALTVEDETYECSDIPAVHAKQGKAPPFYDISYQVVSDWNTYKNIVESYDDIIVVNAHGEIVPVPSGYEGLSWADKIAEAMLNRHIIWVHIAGYPFYYGWRQEASSKEEWGEEGFQRVMSHINMGNVTIPGLSGEERDSLTGMADNNLHSPYCRWYLDMVERVSRDRPLRESDFGDYVILSIWGEQDYYTGAVIAFVKPNERFAPNTRNFGAIVHIGTNRTFHGEGWETDKDYWRAYVGVAAAVWTEMSGFEGVTMSSRFDDGDVNFTIHAAPAITDLKWWSDADYWEIHIGFFVLGGLKRPYDSGIDIDKIGLYVKPEIPDDEGSVTIEPYNPLSRNAYPYDDTMNTGAGAFGLVLKSVIFGFSFFDPTHMTTVLSAVMLFSDWTSTITYADNSQNNEEINTEFLVDTYTTSEGSYDIIEFQSVFAVSLKIYKSTGIGDREGWRIIPIRWGAQLIPTGVAWSDGPITGDTIELAVYFSHGSEYTATVFSDSFEDFELAAGEYSAGDMNEGSGADTWGTIDNLYGFQGTPNFPAGKCLWCAAQGTNSIYNEEPNIEELQYDKNMEAFLVRYMDLKPYKQARLFYLIGVYGIEPGDYLELYVLHTNYTSTLVDTITSSNSSTNRSWRTIELQNTVKSVKFVFHSDDDTIVGVGATIYYIEIRATIPNDAETNQDAGDNIDNPTSTDKQEFSGYLDDEDWYTLSTSPADNQNTSFQVTPSENAIFNIELYNAANNEKIAGPSQTIQFELPEGTYKIRIYSLIGFGPYSFEMGYIDTGGGGGGGGGGGCPTLFIWNGTAYVEEGILDIHAESDITVQHWIENALTLENHAYRLQLRELDNNTSHIDQVKLYAVDDQGERHLCPLTYAYHNELGRVTWRLFFDDENRVDLTPTQTISLKFLPSLPYSQTAYFIFEINGYNPKGGVVK